MSKEARDTVIFAGGLVLFVIGGLMIPYGKVRKTGILAATIGFGLMLIASQ